MKTRRITSTVDNDQDWRLVLHNLTNIRISGLVPTIGPNLASHNIPLDFRNFLTISDYHGHKDNSTSFISEDSEFVKDVTQNGGNLFG